MSPDRADQTRAEWDARAATFDDEPDLFWSPVNTIEDLLVDEQFLAGGGIVAVPDETGAQLMLTTPADFDGRPPEPRWRAPRLGEHHVEVLEELGYDEAAIAAFVVLGVVSPPLP